MKILIKPSEIIERCIWDEYVRFALKDKYNKEEIRNIIEANEEFEIDESMAFVIGLLNRIYTPNIIYKLNQSLKSDLENKSVVVEKRLQINKDILEDSALKFIKKIPAGYVSDDILFNKNLEKLENIITLFIYNINQLGTTTFKNVSMVKCKQVKKIINEIII